MVVNTKELLENNNIVFWLDEGTLLGAMRNGEIIPGDGDIDFSIWDKNLDQVLNICKELEKCGYNIKYQKHLPYVEDLVQIYTPLDKKMSNIHVDINIYNHSNNDAIRRGLHYPYGKIGKILVYMSKILYREKIKRNNLRSILISIIPYNFRRSLSLLLLSCYKKYCVSVWQVVPKIMFDKLIYINFLNMEFCVPEQYNEYLTYRYGFNWRIPDLNWDWKNSNDLAIKYRKLNYLDKDI
jgi:phosphorylcholine metabolism protein LicD|tara:strand:+ start:81 stop:797 length:717 start_codon:yes stop_codon:yes gene_type:complete